MQKPRDIHNIVLKLKGDSLKKTHVNKGKTRYPTACPTSFKDQRLSKAEYPIFVA